MNVGIVSDGFVCKIDDGQQPTLLSCLDMSLRRLGGAPTYALTDNERTVTVEHVARVAVRHPEVVAAGRHYGLQVATCVPFDPESKARVA
jgi:transposase